MSESTNSENPARRRRSGSSKDKKEVPVSLLGYSGGWEEKLAALLLVALGAAVLYLEPGYNRPLRLVTILLSGLATVGAGYFTARRPLGSKFLFTLVALAAWWLLSLLSSFFTIDVFRSQQTMLLWTGGSGLFLLTSLALTSGRVWRATLQGLILAAASVCLAGLTLRTENGPFTATFTNRDTFAVIPLIGAFLCLTLAREGQALAQRLHWAGALFFSFFVLMSGARAALLGGGVGVLVWLAVLSLQKDRDLVKRAASQMAVVAVLACLAGVLSGSVFSLAGRIGEAANGKDIQGVTMRHDVLVYGLEGSRQRAMLGGGPGTFALVYQNFRPRGVVPDYIVVNYGHNDYIEMLLEVGWPAFLCWLVFSGLVILRGIRLVRFGIATWEASALVGAIVGLGTFATLNFILPVPTVFLWQMLVLGLLQSLPATRPGGPTPTPSKGQLPLALLLVLAGFFCSYRSFRHYQAARLEWQARQLAGALRLEEARQLLDQALAWHPEELPAYIQKGKLLGNLGRLKKDKELIAQADAAFKTALKISPTDPDVLRIGYFFYSANHQLGEAEKLLERFHEVVPHMAWVLPRLVEIRLLQGKMEQAARALYEEALDNEKELPRLVELLTRLEQTRAGAGVALCQEWSGHDSTRPMQLARQAAGKCMDRKWLAAAERFLTYQKEAGGETSETRYQLSRIHGLRDEKAKQLEILQALAMQAKDHPKDPAIDSALVDLVTLRKLGSMTPQVRELENRLKTTPRSAPMRLVLSQVYLNEKKIEKATDVISAGVDLLPEDARLQARMGTCLRAQGLGPMSLEYFEQALRLNPRNKEALAALGRKAPRRR